MIWGHACTRSPHILRAWPGLRSRAHGLRGLGGVQAPKTAGVFKQGQLGSHGACILVGAGQWFSGMSIRVLLGASTQTRTHMHDQRLLCERVCWNRRPALDRLWFMVPIYSEMAHPLGEYGDCQPVDGLRSGMGANVDAHAYICNIYAPRHMFAC